MSPPPHETLVLALEQLYALGALNHMGELTKVNAQGLYFSLKKKSALTPEFPDMSCEAKSPGLQENPRDTQKKPLNDSLIIKNSSINYYQ